MVSIIQIEKRSCPKKKNARFKGLSQDLSIEDK